MKKTVIIIIATCVSLITAIGLNIAWQYYHCGTPVHRINPGQIYPCEPVNKITEEIDDWTRRARENPAR